MMKFSPYIIQATIEDYPIIQNMARFYIYDMTRTCGFISEDWACPKDGLYACFDLKNYFEDEDKKAFLVKVDDELAGFVLLDKEDIAPNIGWNMGEFFILGKFQGKGVGKKVAYQMFEMNPGFWRISVIPENTSALSFWRKIISNFSLGKYLEIIKNVDWDQGQPKRYVLTFDSRKFT